MLAAVPGKEERVLQAVPCGREGRACTRGRANRAPESLPLQGSSTKVPGRRLGGDQASRLNDVLVWARGQSGELRIKGLNSSAF